MPDLNLNEQVKQVLEVEGAAPVPAQPTENVTSQEVKTETIEQKPVVEDVNSNKNKSEEIVSNLNIALKEEREARRMAEEAAKKAAADAAEALEFKKKMEGLFVEPKQEQQEQPPVYYTQADVEAFYAKKEAEKLAELENIKKNESILNEVKRLENEWNGADGKPKYDDQEVLKWQQDNNKLYLTPEDAFFQMKRNDIIDYEAKQRLSSQKQIPDASRPSALPGERQPEEQKLKTAQEIRNAILEAISGDDTV